MSSSCSWQTALAQSQDRIVRNKLPPDGGIQQPHRDDQNPGLEAVMLYLNDPASRSYDPRRASQVTVAYNGDLRTVTPETIGDPRFINAMIKAHGLKPCLARSPHPLYSHPLYFDSLESFTEWRKQKVPVFTSPPGQIVRPDPAIRISEGRWKCVCEWRLFVSSL